MKEKVSKINFTSPPERVFRNIDHYKTVYSAIINALSVSTPKGRQLRQDNSYLINKLVVKFTDLVDAEEISIDYQNGLIILEAPFSGVTSEQTEADRRMYYYGKLIKSVDAIATVGITQIYLVLSDEGRMELEEKSNKTPKTEEANNKKE